MVYQDLCEHTELALNKSLCIYNQTEKKTNETLWTVRWTKITSAYQKEPSFSEHILVTSQPLFTFVWNNKKEKNEAESAPISKSVLVIYGAIASSSLTVVYHSLQRALRSQCYIKWYGDNKIGYNLVKIYRRSFTSA